MAILGAHGRLDQPSVNETKWKMKHPLDIYSWGEIWTEVVEVCGQTCYRWVSGSLSLYLSLCQSFSLSLSLCVCVCVRRRWKKNISTYRRLIRVFNPDLAFHYEMFNIWKVPLSELCRVMLSVRWYSANIGAGVRIPVLLVYVMILYPIDSFPTTDEAAS